jgi:hypothetical protein
LVFGLGVAVMLTAAGCGAGPQEAAKQSAPSSSAPTTSSTEGDAAFDTTAPPAVEETTPEEVAEQPSVAKIGATQWFNYEDGLKVQVTKLTRFKIGQYASGGKAGGPGVIATVTIRNGTKKTVDLSLTTIKMNYGANGIEAESVYDENTGDGFSGTATPGKAKTAKFAFAVPANQTVDIEVEPGFLDYESVHFEGSIK